MRRRQEAEPEGAEMEMLRFSLGVTRMDRIRNEYIRGAEHARGLGDNGREARRRWLRHVQRRDPECRGRRMLRLDVPGWEPREDQR